MRQHDLADGIAGGLIIIFAVVVQFIPSVADGAVIGKVFASLGAIGVGFLIAPEIAEAVAGRITKHRP